MGIGIANPIYYCFMYSLFWTLYFLHCHLFKHINLSILVIMAG